jgi:hypothetical protein
LVVSAFCLSQAFLGKVSHSKAIFDANDLPLPPCRSHRSHRLASWCNDVFTILSDLDLQQWWQRELPQTVVSYPAFQSTIKQHVLQLDKVKWQRALDAAPARPPASDFSARLHYFQFRTTYGANSYLLHNDRKSAMCNFGLKARIVHDVPLDSPHRSGCDFCPNSKVEVEFHLLMECVAYTDSWKYMWLNIEHILRFDHCSMIGAAFQTLQILRNFAIFLAITKQMEMSDVNIRWIALSVCIFYHLQPSASTSLTCINAMICCISADSLPVPPHVILSPPMKRSPARAASCNPFPSNGKIP